jgi:HlyD family secretion protein
MLSRIILAVVVVASLTALLIFSQARTPPPRVSGYLEAEDIRLGSRLGGRIREVLVEEGQSVKAHDVLVRLEEFDLDERILQSEAELRARQAELQRLTAGFRDEEKGQAAARVERLKQKVKGLKEGPREEEKESARARVRLAQAQFDAAKSTHDRNVALSVQNPGAVSREAIDRSSEDLKVAQANKEVRVQEFQLLEKGNRAEDIAGAEAELAEADQAWRLTMNGSRAEEIEQAKASVAAAQAAVAILEANRAELDILSPAAGTVDAVELQPGDLVAAGAPVLSVILTDRLWVRAYVPEGKLNLQIGQKMRVTIDSVTGAFIGTLTYISRQAEFTPSNVQTPEERSKQVFRIKVQLPPDERLRPGMSADVWLEN